MESTDKIIKKAKEATSVQNLMEMAQEEGIELSEAEAEQYYAFLHHEGELSDDELSMVAGGKSSNPDQPPKYKVGQKFTIYFPVSRGTRHGEIKEIKPWRERDTNKLCYTYVCFIEEYNNLQYIHLENYGSDVKIVD